MNLIASETRVLGCLLEKQVTTPEQYPLTLNSLRLACNQSTNRDPVVDYDEDVLRDALHRLARRGYARLASGRRAPKYRHLLAEALPLSEDEHAVLCVLLLRGPQTPGELKQRAERMHAFAGLEAVHETLERLIARGLVARLERRPGQKEERYGHLLSKDVEEESPPGTGPATSSPYTPSPPSTVVADEGVPEGVPALPATARVVVDLEERVARLERQVSALRAALGETDEPAEPVEERQVEPMSTFPA